MQHARHVSRQLTGALYCQKRVTLDCTRVGNLQSQRCLLTLAIETSCDDTCVAILERSSQHTQNALKQTKPDLTRQGAKIPHHSYARLHFNEKVTLKNSGVGGINPIEALSSHRANLAELIDRALLSLPFAQENDVDKRVTCRDGSHRQKPDFISVTRGPGMRSNLSCGLDTAKGLAVAWQVPMVGVHHMQAHTLTPRMVHALSEDNSLSEYQPDFPFLTLLVSGGHTMLLYSTGLTEHQVLASTRDVAIGDTLDKCGRLLLSEEVKADAPDTAFGKYLSEYAFPNRASFTTWPLARRRHDEIDKPPNQYGWQMQTPLANTRHMIFSFSSIASRTESLLQERESALQQQLPPDERLLLAQTAIGTAFEHLSSRTIIALEDLRTRGIDIRNLVVSGGVAANDFLRYFLRTTLDMRGFEGVNLVFPPVKYCTDNAAMIAWTGLEMYQAGYVSTFDVDSIRKWSMDAAAEDGGILGVAGWILRPNTSH